MAFNSYSNRKGYAQEMAKVRISGEAHPLSHRRRHTTRRDNLTPTREHGSRWPGKEAESMLPQDDSQRDSSQGQLRVIRRRLHCHRSLITTARTSSQTVGRSLPEGTRVRTVKRKNPYHPY